jgi:hypothetical protein
MPSLRITVTSSLFCLIEPGEAHVSREEVREDECERPFRGFNVSTCQVVAHPSDPGWDTSESREVVHHWKKKKGEPAATWASRFDWADELKLYTWSTLNHGARLMRKPNTVGRQASQAHARPEPGCSHVQWGPPGRIVGDRVAEIWF